MKEVLFRELGLSLVLATLGRVEEISRFFQSAKIPTSVPVEIIVVDQNNDDRLAALIEEGRRSGLTIIHIRIAPRRGLSLARNIGLSAARYSIVGFPDDDCWYEPSVCQRVIDRFRATPDIDGLVARWIERHDTQGHAAHLNPALQRKFSGIPIASICLFFRIEAVQAAGAFDEKLGVGTWFGSSEETDLVFQMLGAGRKFEFDPNIVVHHFWSGAAIPVSGTANAVLRNAMSRARGTGAIYAKHRLSNTVILRGLLAPLTKVFDFRYGLRGVAYWLGTSIGRWQGFIRWYSLHT